jgi:hypothetical protein
VPAAGDAGRFVKRLNYGSADKHARLRGQLPDAAAMLLLLLSLSGTRGMGESGKIEGLYCLTLLSRRARRKRRRLAPIRAV